MTDEPQSTAGRRQLLVTLCVLGSLALVWILGTAPSAGPDEPAHTVRSAALVRGQFSGDTFGGRDQFFELPAWIGHPGHACFALQEQQPANCATAIPRPEGDHLVGTTADQYPIWGHLAPGLGTYLPASVGNQAARAFDTLVPIGLIAAALSLARRRSRVALGATMLAVTPMAWFSIVVVNPSGLAIAGGVALWAALLHAGWLQRLGTVATTSTTTATTATFDLDRLTAWSIAAGWTALVLPRRDGMIWAALIVGLCALVGAVDLRAVARRLGVGPVVLLTVSTAATLAWAISAETSSSKLLLAMPLIPLLGMAARMLWVHPVLDGPGRRITAGSVGFLGVAGALFALMSLRRAGFDSRLFGQLVAQSGINLEEAIGLLGSLDTPIPRTSLFLWLASLGVLAGAVLMAGAHRAVAAAAGLVLVAVAAAWVLEMNQGNTSTTYWQGRYYLPLLVGVPMVLGWSIGGRVQAKPATTTFADSSSSAPDAERTLLLVTASSAMLVLTMAFGASMRRWGVGTAGPVDPRNWDTYGTVVPPMLLLVAHAAIAVSVVVALSRMAIAHAEADVHQLDTVGGHEY